MRILLALLLLANICEAQIVGAPRRAKMSAASAEADPTVSPAVKAITTADVAKWNTASSYGNHSTEGYLKSVSWSDIQSKPNTLSGFGISDAYPLSGNPSGFITGITSQQVISALGFTPYNSSNPNNYISSITSQNVTNALGFTPINPNGTALQYIAGNGQKITFPTIPADQVNADWNSANGKSQILNKPVIPTNTNQLTNGSGFLTSYTETDPLFDSKFTSKNTGQLSEGSNLYYTDARARAAFSAGSGISINSGVISATTPSTPTYTYNYPARPINSTAFQISTTKESIVTYSVAHTVALTLILASGASTVYLETSANGTTGWQTISSAGYSESLGVGVSVNKSVISNIQGVIPPGYYARIRSVVTGGGSVTYNQGQERF